MTMIKNELEEEIALLIKRYPVLEGIRQAIMDAYLTLEMTYRNQKKLLIAGNGGSAADADHIVGELMKGFRLKRPMQEAFAQSLCLEDEVYGRELTAVLQGALPAIALHNHAALGTAFSNDVDGTFCYAQQVYGYGSKGDTFLGISTSGNSKNIIAAALVARAKQMQVIALTGQSGGKLAKLADVAVVVPKEETYMIQELHLPIYHCWCLMLEKRMFDKEE